jgi:hypothetical protein
MKRIASIIRMEKNWLDKKCVNSNYSYYLLLVTANVVPSSLILSTLMMKAMGCSETEVLKTAKRHIREDSILQECAFPFYASIPPLFGIVFRYTTINNSLIIIPDS